MATSTCVAPRSTAARVLATATPRSLWQCALTHHVLQPGTFCVQLVHERRVLLGRV